MNNFGTRVRAALHMAGMTQKELAEKLGIKQQSVQYLCSDKAKSSRRTPEIARILNTDPGWLSHGVGKFKTNPTSSEQRSQWSIDIGDGTPNVNVLLIDMDDLIDISKSEASTLIPCPATHSRTSYATRVKDATMTAQYGRSYPEGSIIFVDPERADEAKHGDRVIASLEGADGKKIISFKQLGKADGARYLQPINLQYPIITKPFEIIGLVIGMWMPENELIG